MEAGAGSPALNGEVEGSSADDVEVFVLTEEASSPMTSVKTVKVVIRMAPNTITTKSETSFHREEIKEVPVPPEEDNSAEP